MVKAFVGAITVTTALTARMITVGGEIKSFTLDNRSAATIYISYDGTASNFRQFWPGDGQTVPVRQNGIQNLFVYASAATTAGDVEIDIEPVRYREGA
jgi:hypothetical protein